jgi:hypothetical protein
MRKKRKRQITQREDETMIYVSDAVVDVLLTRNYLSLPRDARKQREKERKLSCIFTNLLSHYLVKTLR